MPPRNDQRVALTHRVSIRDGHRLLCFHPELFAWKGTKRAGKQIESITRQKPCNVGIRNLGSKGASHWRPCAIAAATEQMLKTSERARVAGRAKSHAQEAQAKRAQTQRRNTSARWAWQKSNEQSSIDEETYRHDVRPRLVLLRVGAISEALGISMPYASAIRAGKRLPHPRHWQALAKISRYRMN